MMYTSNNVEATLSNVTSQAIFSSKSKQTKRIQLVSTLSKGRNFTKNSFDIVARNGWLLGTVVERRSLSGELSCPALDWQLTGDHLCL